MTIVPAFSNAVMENLGYYVYLLLDPDTNQVFYVGKGVANRIFEHLYEAAENPDEYDKLAVIRDIQRRGKDVQCIFHRHGLSEKEAFEVESSLIDFIGLANITNRVHGHHADDRGHMTIREVKARYDAPEADIVEPVLLIKINKLYRRGMNELDLYESTRKSWRLAPLRRNPMYAFAVFRGIVRQVYAIEHWYRPEDNPSRWAFHGHVAIELQLYVGKSVACYLKPGAQTPTKYVNC